MQSIREISEFLCFLSNFIQWASNFPLEVGLTKQARGTGWWFEEKRRGGRTTSSCLQWTVSRAVNTSRRASLHRTGHFLSPFLHCAQRHPPKCPNRKPPEGVVSACPGPWTGKLFISRASLFNDSCFDWKIGHSFLAALSCQLSWLLPSASTTPPPFSLPGLLLYS